MVVPSGQCILTPEGEGRDRGEALCRFEVSTPGDYVIWVRAFGPSGVSDSFYAAVDRAAPVTVHLEKLHAWHWGLVRDRNAKDPVAREKVRFALDRGQHALAIRNRESGTRIDAVVVVRADSAFSPPAARKQVRPEK